MNAKRCSLLVLVAGLALSGCRTTGESARFVPAAKPVPPSRLLKYSLTDHETLLDE